MNLNRKLISQDMIPESLSPLCLYDTSEGFDANKFLNAFLTFLSEWNVFLHENIRISNWKVKKIWWIWLSFEYQVNESL